MLLRKFTRTMTSHLHPHRNLPSFYVFLFLMILTIWAISALLLSINSYYDLTYYYKSTIFLREGNVFQYFSRDTCADGNSDESRRSNANSYTIRNRNDINIWTRVSDSVHVYSAYLDTREHSHYQSPTRNLTLIRIIGIIKMPSRKEIIRRNPLEWLRIKDQTFLGDSYFCKVFIENKTTGSFTWIKGHTLTHTIIEEGVKVFASAFFNCYVNFSLIQDFQDTSTTTKIRLKNIFAAVYPVDVTDYPDKLVPVRQMNAEESMNNKSLAICVRPLFGPMNDMIKLVQFVSYYHVMGVTRFNFYDMSISPVVLNYIENLSFYATLDVRLKKWNLPTGNTSELWDFGSLAALNDCIYDNMNEYLVIVVDIDELIVPQKNQMTLYNLFNSFGSNFYQLLIRNTFFCNEFCHVDSILGEILPMFACPTRTKKIWNVRIRSKYIINPRKVVSVGHHLVTNYIGQIDHRFTAKSVEVKAEVAILNHYRECRSISTSKHPVVNRLTVHDNTIALYKDMIKESLPYKVWEARHNNL